MATLGYHITVSLIIGVVHCN